MNTHRPALARLFVLFLGSQLLAMAAHAGEAVESIEWLTADALSTADTKPGAAMADKLLGIMRSQWPQVEHRPVVANLKRSWQMLAQGEHACQVGSLRTPEREKIAYFSNTQLVPPVQLIVRRDRLATLPRNEAGEVDLASLLNDARLRGVLTQERSYGPAVDAMLAARPADNKMVVMYGTSDFGSQLLPMVAADRADWSIEYDAILSISIDRERALKNLLVSVPIRNAGDPQAVGVACPRTPWGLAAITGIDKALGSASSATQLREALERWLSPETRQFYRARMDAFYKERAKVSVIR